MRIRIWNKQPRESGTDGPSGRIEESKMASGGNRASGDVTHASITNRLYGPGTNPFRYTATPSTPTHYPVRHIQPTGVKDVRPFLIARRF